MKFLIIAILFATCTLSSCTLLEDCLRECDLQRTSVKTTWACKHECYKVATFEGYREFFYPDCLAVCNRLTVDELVNDCTVACGYFFPLAKHKKTTLHPPPPTTTPNPRDKRKDPDQKPKKKVKKVKRVIHGPIGVWKPVP